MLHRTHTTSHINKSMKDTGMYKKFTAEEMLCEFKKLKCLVFSEEKKVLNEVTKIQKVHGMVKIMNKML
jgi:ABC-type Na+ transport system ATPase subunit NatA